MKTSTQIFLGIFAFFLIGGLIYGFVYATGKIKGTPARTDISIKYYSDQGDLLNYEEDATCDYVKVVSFQRIEDCVGIKCPLMVNEKRGSCLGLLDDGKKTEVDCVREKYYVTSNITELGRFDKRKFYTYCSGEERPEKNIAIVSFKYTLPEFKCYDRTLTILNSEMKRLVVKKDVLCPTI